MMTKLLDLDWINSAAPQYNADQNMYEETGSDNNGNLRIEYLAHTAGPPFSVDRAYGYDSPNRITSDAATSMSRTFAYDAFDTLASEYGGTTTATGTQYLTADHLGSLRLVTSATGGLPQCRDYLPFGEELLQGNGGRPACYAPANEPTQKFTGKERDAETGLDYFGARYFSGAQGRFTSPDEPFADQIPADAQSWNLYNYVRNNPLRFFDPDGRKCIETSNGPADDGTGGGCEAAGVDPSGRIKPQKVTVQDIAPPSALLLAVAQGAQAASPVTDPRFIAGFYSVSMLGGAGYAAYGLYGSSTLTTLGLKYSALGTASGAAFSAAQNTNKFIVPLKHLANSVGRWARFAQGVDSHQAINEALNSPNARFLPNGENPHSFVVITDLGRTVGSKGETSIKVVVDWAGNIWTAYPKK